MLIALASQHAELAEIVDGCTNDDWERPTRCVGWDVASVLAHLALTDEFATASALGELDRYGDNLLGSREPGALHSDWPVAGPSDRCVIGLSCTSALCRPVLGDC